MPPISFLSDFGLADEFVGVVHGVIRRIAPQIEVIDVTHGVKRGDIRGGALALVRAVQYMPPGVALAVVDPGVGTERRPIAAETEWGYFVGPDNGLLAPAVAMTGGAGRIVVLESEEFRLPRDGVTFDGRDVFAPAAAVLASGEATLTALGPQADPDSLTPMLLPLAEDTNGGIDGEVWWVDHFGNAQTNVSPMDLERLGLVVGDAVRLRVGRTTHEVVWSESYGKESGPLIHTDSYGLIAIAIPGGRADEALGLIEGISVGFSSPS